MQNINGKLFRGQENGRLSLVIGQVDLWVVSAELLFVSHSQMASRYNHVFATTGWESRPMVKLLLVGLPALNRS